METAGELSWRRSSYSSSNGGNCVEVAATPGTIVIRDSKNPGSATLAFSCDCWQAFISRTGRA